jgi:hypothetical protein
MMHPSSRRSRLILSKQVHHFSLPMIEFRFAQRNLRWKEKITMFRSHHFIATCFAIIALGTSAVGASAGMRSATGNGDAVEITDLRPFTHVAYIPTGSALSSITIEGIKLVKVATKRRTVTNERYCQPWAEPGGSMYCQRTTEESPVLAYQVTYLYWGRPMVSDEYGNTYFTFSVYFRQDEISPRLREILALGKIRRAALEEFFEVSTSRAPTQQIVIDSANSKLCDGNYLDGNWTRTNPTCEDKIVYLRVASASPYITVRVDPASSRIEAAVAASEPWRK